MVDSTHGWELTGDGLARTSDGGATWTSLKGLPKISYALGTVASFASADVAWLCEQGRVRGSQPSAIGDTRTSASPPALCIATGDGGKTWVAHDVPGSGTRSVGRRRDDATVDSVFAASARAAWVMVGTLDTFAGGGHESIGLIELALLHTVDSGVHWSTVRDQKVDLNTPWPGGAANWVNVGPSGALYVSGFSKAIDRSTDGGATWTTLPAPLPSIGDVGTQVYCSLTESGTRLTVTIRAFVSSNRQLYDEVSGDGGRTWSGPVPALSPPTTAATC
jgi:hypothetical protein